ncbi:MAG: hypothetical protein CVU38_01120 [Chloroflexi bacterium HGW-Chloroflexi-1]|nr:MAG: hypothetical protein CVU38_01120 [Chloroflexi bacterium HGW-Chloroflexi-1]
MRLLHLTPQPPSLRGKGENVTPPLRGEGPGERSPIYQPTNLPTYQPTPSPTSPSCHRNWRCRRWDR